MFVDNQTLIQYPFFLLLYTFFPINNNRNFCTKKNPYLAPRVSQAKLSEGNILEPPIRINESNLLIKKLKFRIMKDLCSVESLNKGGEDYILSNVSLKEAIMTGLGKETKSAKPCIVMQDGITGIRGRIMVKTLKNASITQGFPEMFKEVGNMVQYNPTFKFNFISDAAGKITLTAAAMSKEEEKAARKAAKAAAKAAEAAAKAAEETEA